MKFCYECSQGCCGCPVRSTVMTGFCHYFIYGLFAVIFVFTNRCYPELYYVDYMYGGSGGSLIAVSVIGGFLASSKRCQPLRFIFAFLVFANVVAVVVATFYYTIERWDDIVVTALTAALRRAVYRDFIDYSWYIWMVISCMNCPVLLIYLIYILSYMCNSWKSYLFTDPYRNYVEESPFIPPITVPAVPQSNAYPTARNH